KVGQNHDNRVMRRDPQQEFQGGIEVRAATARLREKHFADDAQHVLASLARRNKFFHFVGEQDQAERGVVADGCNSAARQRLVCISIWRIFLRISRGIILIDRPKRPANQYTFSDSTFNPLSLSRPFRKLSSMRKRMDSIFAPTFRTSCAAAAAVPPVASRSS